VVVAAQAFHWFDLDKALPEMARVIKPEGHLALVWNIPDESIPWVRKLCAIMSPTRHEVDPTEVLVESGYFAPVEHAAFTFWQEVDRDTVVDLALSRSEQIALGDAERAEIRAKVEALYDDYGRGTGGMRIPYVCHAWRARVTAKQPKTPAPPVAPTTLLNSSHESISTDTAVALPRVLDSYGRDEPGTDEVKLFTWH
jgi:SAM-dependent methyltransferase